VEKQVETIDMLRTTFGGLFGLVNTRRSQKTLGPKRVSSRTCRIEQLEDRHLLSAVGVFQRISGGDNAVHAQAGVSSTVSHDTGHYSDGNPPALTMAEAKAQASDQYSDAAATVDATNSPAVGSSSGVATADVNVGISGHANWNSNLYAATAGGGFAGSSSGEYSLSLTGTPVQPRFHGHWLILSSGDGSAAGNSGSQLDTSARVDIITSGGSHPGDWFVAIDSGPSTITDRLWTVSYELPDGSSGSYVVTGGAYIPIDLFWAYDGTTDVIIRTSFNGDFSESAFDASGNISPGSVSLDWSGDAQGWLRIDDPNAPGSAVLIPGGTKLPNPEAPLVPPKVENVTISDTLVSNSYGTNPPYDFDSHVGSQEQLRTVPVGNANKIAIKFTKNVVMSGGDLHLLALNKVSNLPGYTFDPPGNNNGHTATWTYVSALPAAQYQLWLPDSIHDFNGNSLDGEWSNPGSYNPGGSSVVTTIFPSGNDIAGGDFKFVYTILGGDANRNNWVNISDYGTWQSNSDPNNPNQGHYRFIDGDFSGNGIINISDYGILQTNFNLNWQTLAILGDYDNDHDVDSADQAAFASYLDPNSPNHDLADLNGDGNVNSVDSDAFNVIFNAVGSGTSNPLRLLF
jgi:hypothetical protein